MQLEFMWKSNNSDTGHCPALYQTDSGDYVVQGIKLSDEDRQQLRDLADNEDAVLVPANVLERLRA